jgi:hypothetical protein
MYPSYSYHHHHHHHHHGFYGGFHPADLYGYL